MGKPAVALAVMLLASVSVAQVPYAPRPKEETDLEKKSLSVLQSVALFVKKDDDAAVFAGHAVLLRSYISKFDEKGSDYHRQMKKILTGAADELSAAASATIGREVDAGEKREKATLHVVEYLHKNHPDLVAPWATYLQAIAAASGSFPKP